MFRNLLLFSFLALTISINAQISGHIVDADGNPLAYATVQVMGTTNGAVTNHDGYYSFYPNEKELIRLSIRYIGYKTHIETVDYSGEAMFFNVTLNQEDQVLDKVVISADREDPAYAIMRKAIANRSAYYKTTDTLSAEVYIKGRFQSDYVPDNFIGKKILEEKLIGLDSNGRGILYLSESLSHFDRIRPNKYKEKIKKYNVTGIDVPYSFNTAIGMDFSIYDAKVLKDFGLVSPLANNAMAHYKFELLYSGLGEDLIGYNKIRVWPKHKSSPAMTGIVYVRDESYHLYQAQLMVEGSRVPGQLLDTMKVELQSIQTKEGAFIDWYKKVEMSFDFFGIRPYGSFHVIYSDVELNKNYPKNFFNSEVFTMEDAEKNQSMDHWNEVRPIVLSEIESLAYARHDSLTTERKLRADSLRLHGEKSKLSINSILGRSYYSKNGKVRFGHELLSQPGFNAVQGISFTPEIYFKTRYDSLETYNSFNAKLAMNYGFTENELRPMIRMNYKLANLKGTRFKMNVGREIVQYNQEYPVPSIPNALYTLLANKNYAKYFERDVIELGFREEVTNGLLLDVLTGYRKRRPERNEDIKTWSKGDRQLTSNDPLNPTVYEKEAFIENDEIFVSTTLTIRPKQRYMTYPDTRVRFESKWPLFQLKAGYKYNLESKQNIGRLELIVRKNYNFGHVGGGQVFIRGGAFVLDKPTYFIDFKHFRENDTWFGNRSGFNRLPYFEYSTNDKYASFHTRHNFKGFIWNKLPLLRKLEFMTTLELRALTVPNKEIYSEVAFGIGNIGYKIIRPLSVRFVVPLSSERDVSPGFVFNLNLPLN